MLGVKSKLIDSSIKKLGEVHVESGNIAVSDSLNFSKFSELEFDDMFETHKKNGYLLESLPGDGVYQITGKYSSGDSGYLQNIQIPTMIYGFQYEEEYGPSSIVVGEKVSEINCPSGYIGINDPVNWKIYDQDKKTFELWNSIKCTRGPGTYPIHEMILEYQKDGESVNEVYGYIIDLTTKIE